MKYIQFLVINIFLIKHHFFMNLLLCDDRECKYRTNHIYQVTLQSGGLSAHQKGYALRHVSPLQAKRVCIGCSVQETDKRFLVASVVAFMTSLRLMGGMSLALVLALHLSFEFPYGTRFVLAEVSVDGCPPIRQI